MTRLVLASASPARLATLRAAGFVPQVQVSAVDEDAVLAELLQGAPATSVEVVPAADQVLALARAKARDVARGLQSVLGGIPAGPGTTGVSVAPAGTEPTAGDADIDEADDVLVIGCDSMLETGTPPAVVGKPHTAAVARERWRAMRGTSAVLHTGHWLVRRQGAAGPGPDQAPLVREVGATSSTTVHFANLSDAEIDAYIATGEPLKVAGAFTIDGLGGQFVTGIEGDHHGVVGISLPLVRELAAQLDLTLTDLWAR